MKRLERLVIMGAGAALLAAVAIVGCNRTDNPRPRASEFELNRTAVASNVATADALLAAGLMSALRVDPVTRDSDIQVVVAQGHVRLTGFVHNAAAKLRAGELAQQAQGIVAVENRLILRYHADMSANPLGEARVRL